MKAAGILLAASLLMATQAFAWSEREQNVLLGLSAGLLVSHIAEMHHHRRSGTTYTYARPREVVHVYPERHHKKRHCRKHHNRNERDHCNTFR